MRDIPSWVLDELDLCKTKNLDPELGWAGLISEIRAARRQAFDEWEAWLPELAYEEDIEIASLCNNALDDAALTYAAYNLALQKALYYRDRRFLTCQVSRKASTPSQARRAPRAST